MYQLSLQLRSHHHMLQSQNFIVLHHPLICLLFGHRTICPLGQMDLYLDVSDSHTVLNQHVLRAVQAKLMVDWIDLQMYLELLTPYQKTSSEIARLDIAAGGEHQKVIGTAVILVTDLQTAHATREILEILGMFATQESPESSEIL